MHTHIGVRGTPCELASLAHVLLVVFHFGRRGGYQARLITGAYPARFARAPFALRKGLIVFFEASPRLGFARATTRMLCLGWQVFLFQHRRRRQTVGPPGGIV